MRLKFGFISDKKYIYTSSDGGMVTGKFSFGDDTYTLKNTTYETGRSTGENPKDGINLQLTHHDDQPISAQLLLHSSSNVVIYEKVPGKELQNVYYVNSRGQVQDKKPIPDVLLELARDIRELLAWAREEHANRVAALQRYL